jgi:hypothetical protein
MNDAKVETPGSRQTKDEEIINTNPEWLEKLSDMVDISPKGVVATLREQCTPIVKGQRREFSDAELAYLGSTAVKYDLNPFTREIYAFPKKGGGIQIIVPIDGWLKIINRREDFDGLQTTGLQEDSIGQYIEATIWRRNISRPIVVREYLHECQMDTDPWRKWPIRMLRHKAVIQTARYAFALADIIDPDEAARHAIADVLDMVDVPPAKDKEHFTGEDGGLPKVGETTEEKIPSRPKTNGVKQATTKAYNYGKNLAKDKGDCPDDETYKKFLEWKKIPLPISHDDNSALINAFEKDDFSELHKFLGLGEDVPDESPPIIEDDFLPGMGDEKPEAPKIDEEKTKLFNDILDLKLADGGKEIYKEAIEVLGADKSPQDMTVEELEKLHVKMMEIAAGPREKKSKKKSSKK